MKKKSVFMTVMIYGLLIYIFLGFAKSGVKNIVSDGMILSGLKYVIKDSFVQVKYLSESNINNDSDKHLRYNFLMDIIDMPVAKYTMENTAINVADELNVRCFNDSFGETDISLENSGNINTDDGGINQSDDESKDDDDNEKVPGLADYVEEENNAKKNSGEDVGNKEGNEETLNDREVSVKSIDTSGITYEFLMKNYYTVVSSTTLTPEDLNVQELMGIDMKMQTKNDSPQILIYHTHGQEGFADTPSGDVSKSIIGVGDYLTKILTEKYGYNVIHLSDSFDYVNGVFDRHKAYDYAYEKISQVLADNPSIEVVIDLHRDGVGENTHLITEVNGKQTAQIMFFNGISRLNDIGEIGYLYNPYRRENLAFSLKMKLTAEEKYKGFTRRNYIQAYQYNLHLRPKSTLIEAGAQNNTFEEVKNAMEPLADILNQVLSNG